jgi:hypothetical protein
MGCGGYDGVVAACVDLVATRVGEPDAGNLHVRFDEGEQPSREDCSLLDCYGFSLGI